jgi:hypothetical protein
MRQSFYFLTESVVRVEFHTTGTAEGMSLQSLHNPPGEPDKVTFASVDEAADAMAAQVTLLGMHAAVLRLIRYRRDPSPLTMQHLGRFAVPLLPFT